MNINSSMPVYLSNVLLHITDFQTEDRNHRTLFARFRDCPHNKDGDAVAQYRVVPRYRYCWWGTAFHFTPMQMPLRLSVAEVNGLTADHFKQRVSDVQSCPNCNCIDTPLASLRFAPTGTDYSSATG